MDKKQIKIIIVDDERKTARLLCDYFIDNDYDAHYFTTPSAALSNIDNDTHILITDLKMPQRSGIELIPEAISKNPKIGIILMTAYASVETAVEAMKRGASDYIIKPFDENDLLTKVKCIINEKGLDKTASNDAKYEIIGKSKAIKLVKKQITKVASTDATVLISGESGTGKELVARNIHLNSHRKNAAFIAINCAAIAENLLESELFGYEKGAFTGADRRKIGLFEAAESGTIFLDEIGELPLSLQAKLLRVLQERKIHRLGSLIDVEIDVRVIAATNKDLEDLVKEGKFRDDLFYRLSVFPIKTPPLREHLDDIPLLLEHFLSQKSCFNNSCNITELSEYLKNFKWPGNIRQLSNVIERALIMADNNSLLVEHFDIQKQNLHNQSGSIQRSDKLEDVEKQMLLDALEKAGGNKTKAAEILGITRRMIYSRMEKYGLR